MKELDAATLARIEGIARKECADLETYRSSDPITRDEQIENMLVFALTRFVQEERSRYIYLEQDIASLDFNLRQEIEKQRERAESAEREVERLRAMLAKVRGWLTDDTKIGTISYMETHRFYEDASRCVSEIDAALAEREGK